MYSEITSLSLPVIWAPPIHIGQSFYALGNPAFEQTITVYQEQACIIKELAAESNCVIVGRCADHILKEYKPFRIFVYADMESKMKRCREKGPEEETLSDKELRQKISGIDKKRAKYYEFYTGHPWGDKLNFDLCLNTTQTVVKEMVPVIAKLFC
nr:cytidylate kinase-like family protein [Anaerofilum sp. An201]